MSLASPTLHMLCGKIASGKSTLAARLSEPDGTVLIAEDVWLKTLFSDQMSSGPDYVRCAAKLRNAMGPHISALLKAGVSVVLDFPANTVENRAWMRGILDATGAADRLHVLNTPDEVCLARLRERNARGDHQFVVTDEQFHRFSRHFVAPSTDEGFDLEVHGQGE